jgi:1,4-dihydroxy-6-naphthoate synthase
LRLSYTAPVDLQEKPATMPVATLEPSADLTVLKLGHSPDPDDAFMFYALAQNPPLIQTGRWRFEHVLQDIQTLNQRAKHGELEITAISIHAYPYVADKYALTSCGSSMGDGYGPMIVTREPMSIDQLQGKTIAIPGELTTAFLALQLCIGKARDAFEFHVVPFDQILEHVKAGHADAGLIIHEGQLTFQNQGLHLVVDLGAWWKEKTGLPLPLGGNCIRKDLGAEAMQEVTDILKESIQYSCSLGGIWIASSPTSSSACMSTTGRSTTARRAERRFPCC